MPFPLLPFARRPSQPPRGSSTHSEGKNPPSAPATPPAESPLSSSFSLPQLDTPGADWGGCCHDYYSGVDGVVQASMEIHAPRPRARPQPSKSVREAAGAAIGQRARNQIRRARSTNVTALSIRAVISAGRRGRRGGVGRTSAHVRPTSRALGCGGLTVMRRARTFATNMRDAQRITKK